MDVAGKVVILTGGASGIGAALSRKLAEAGARLVIADRDIEGAAALAETIGALAMRCDVTVEADIQRVVSDTEAELGPISMFVSNAGLGRGEPDHAASASNKDWQLQWDIHVMSHVYAARAVLPGMIERGEGYLVQMASAAGLLLQIGDAAYSATKRAAVSFAESLAVTHGDEGIQVSVICPQYVSTPIIGLSDADAGSAPNLISADAAAAAIMAGIRAEDFLILTHPQVTGYMAQKAADYDRWLTGMRLLRAKAISEFGGIDPSSFYKIV